MFHKAISQSGVGTNPWAYNEWTNKPSHNAFLFLETLGKKTTDPKVAYEFLSFIDAKQLIQSEQKFKVETEFETVSNNKF